MRDDRFTGHRFLRVCSTLCLLFPALGLSSCSGVQSALDPAGPEARDVATLFFTMLIGGGVILVAMIGMLVYASRKRPEPHSVEAAGRLILWGGAILPVIILGALLSYAVWLMPNIRPWFAGADGGMRRIEVSGEQFWWRVRYLDAGGKLMFETANEIRMPVGERVLFELTSPDVIHSFWIPSLGGKMDMIPGRTNRLTLEASRPGTYRGVCAEFCGPSHALMAFPVTAMDVGDYEAWLGARRATMSGPQDADGLAPFLKQGCGACHAIAGTEARGTIGPDLTAFGDRATVGAGTLPNTVENLARFIRHPGEVKPQVQMPDFGMLPTADIDRIAVYLKGLK